MKGARCAKSTYCLFNPIVFCNCMGKKKPILSWVFSLCVENTLGLLLWTLDLSSFLDFFEIFHEGLREGDDCVMVTASVVCMLGWEGPVTAQAEPVGELSDEGVRKPKATHRVVPGVKLWKVRKWYGSPEGWNSSAESGCCTPWCWILWHVACCLHSGCSVSLTENMLLPPLNLEIAPLVTNRCVSFLRRTNVAVSINEVLLAALMLGARIL